MKLVASATAFALLTTVAEAQLMHGVTDSLSGGGVPTFLALSCPSGGLVSVPSTNFTVTYHGGTFNGTTNTVSMSAFPAGGTFTPVSPITPASGTLASFTFTPGATPTSYTITVTTSISGVPVVPASCTYNATSSAASNCIAYLAGTNNCIAYQSGTNNVINYQ